MLKYNGMIEDTGTVGSDPTDVAFELGVDSQSIELEFRPQSGNHMDPPTLDVLIDVFEGVLVAKIWGTEHIDDDNPEQVITLHDFRKRAAGVPQVRKCPYCAAPLCQPTMEYDDGGYSVAIWDCGNCGATVEVKHIPGPSLTYMAGG